jgi:hypothetical protein
MTLSVFQSRRSDGFDEPPSTKTKILDKSILFAAIALIPPRFISELAGEFSPVQATGEPDHDLAALPWRQALSSWPPDS